MNKNITLAVDEQVLAKVQRIAVQKNTTVNALVRDYLEHLSRREDRWQEPSRRMRDIAADANADIGPVTWTCGDLHER